MDNIVARIANFPGKASFYYKNLVTGETAAFNQHYAHSAASVIKIPVMVEAFRRFEEGSLKKTDVMPLKDEDRVPPCGVLTFMHTGLEVSMMDMIWLMITISDNMATNMLIEKLGVEAIQAGIEANGLENTRLERKLFEKRPEHRHKRNRISAFDMAVLLERIYCGTLISPAASKDMLGVLMGQQLNNKIPFLLPLDYSVAHKTGEDGGTTHDVGIVYAKQPFIVCFCGNEVEAPAFNRLMAEVTLELVGRCGGTVE